MATNNSTAGTDVNKLLKTIIQPDGSLKYPKSVFHNTIEVGGKFAPEKDRYHLYVAYACPWAHRTLIVRALKGLEAIIPVSIVSPRLGEKGWPFANADAFPGSTTDPVYDSEYMRDLYIKADPQYSGRFSVPVLWDKKHHTIVNNESSQIIKILNSAFNDLLPPEKAAINLRPNQYIQDIETVTGWVHDTVNEGVYKAGVAQSQSAYETAVTALFESLDKLEEMLNGKDYLIGDILTEADVRLYVTIVRFDPVYHGHYKCNIRNIRHGYPAIHLWLRKLYWNNAVFGETTRFDHIKTTYYGAQKFANPNGVIPMGPVPAIEPL